jgi:ribose transport system permease protein
MSERMRTEPPAIAPPLLETRRVNWGAVLQQLGALAGLILAFAFFSTMRPRTFFTLGTVELVLRNTAIVGTAALGMTMVIISNGIDLSVGSQIALVTVVAAMLVRAGVAPIAAACAGVAAAALCGTVIGLLITGLKLMPFIVTLGMLSILRGTAKQLAEDRNVYMPDAFLRQPMPWIGKLMVPLSESQQWMILPAGVWLMIGLSLMVAGVLRYTKFGRHLFAIGSNEQTARLCGVNVWGTKLLVYTVAGLLTGIAGVMEFSRLRVGDPTTASGRELDVIAAVVIGGGSLSGGQGSVIGTLIGALLMTVIRTGCVKMGLTTGVQEMVTGAIIIIAVALDRLQRRGA